MVAKQNWFSRLALIIASGALLYIYQFMIRSQYVILKGYFGIPALVTGLLVCAAIAVVWFVSRKRLTKCAFWKDSMEWPMASVILLISMLLRVLYVVYMPIEPQSDFWRFSSGAEYIASGTLQTEGSWFSDYIVLFPKTIGYSVFLSLVYSLFGIPNVFAGQMVNVVLAMGSCILCWRIVRRSAGRKAGIAALAMSAFFPSQILFSNVLASEYLFVFLMLLSLWVMTLCFDALRHWKIKRALCCALCCGAIIAVSQYVRAIGGLVLVAVLICLFSMRGEGKGYRRYAAMGCAAAMLAGFIAAGSIAAAGTEKLVERDIDGGLADSGWYLYVGMNRETVGAYNAQDVAYWNELQQKSQTLQEAKEACLQAAIQRGIQDLPSLPKLLVGKFERLWGDDGFACDYNLIYKAQQGTLTAEQSAFLQAARIACSMYYLFMLALCGQYVAKAWKKKTLDIGYPMLLIWLGTIAAHLLLENMNRYHFHVLSLMPFIAAAGLFRTTAGENRVSE